MTKPNAAQLNIQHCMIQRYMFRRKYESALNPAALNTSKKGKGITLIQRH